MHVASIPNRKSPPTYLLRETYREDGKVKHNTIGNITSLGIEKISLIDAVLKNHKLAPVDQAFHLQKTTPHGHVEAIQHISALRGSSLRSLVEDAGFPRSLLDEKHCAS